MAHAHIPRDCYGLGGTNGGHIAIPCTEDSDEIVDKKKKRQQKLDRVRKKTRQFKDAMALSSFLTVSLEQTSGLLVCEHSGPLPLPGPSAFSAPLEEQGELISFEREVIEIEKRLLHINLQNDLLNNVLRLINIATLGLINSLPLEQGQTQTTSEFPY